MTMAFHSCEYKREIVDGKKKPIIWVVGRDESGERSFLDFDFIPYFYIQQEDAHFLQENHPELIQRMDHGYESLIGRDKLVKVSTYDPSDVPILRDFIRENGGRTFEADVLFNLRALINHNLKDGVLKTKRSFTPVEGITYDWRICILDIETLTPRSDRKEDPNGQFPITCITLWDSWFDEYTFMYQYDHELDIPEEITQQVDHVFYFHNERSLLKGILKWFKDYDPDIVCGYLVDYDTTQIVKRMRNLRVSANQLSPIGQTTDHGKSVNIKGREIFDLYKAYRTVRKEELLAYTLEYILEKEGASVRKIPVWDFKEEWLNNPLNVIERNIIDVIGTVEITQKLELIEFIDAIRRQVGCRLNDAMIRSRVVDILLLREAREMGYILPSSRKPLVTYETLGGLVDGGKQGKPIVPGIYENVAYLDITSAYPTAIMDNNISPETFVDRPPSALDCHHLMPGIAFFKEPEGILTRIIKKLSVLRNETQAKMKNYHYDNPEYKKLFKEQEAMKYQINAVYGNTKYEYARLKSDVVMEAVTFMARQVLDYITNIVWESHNVIYRDTDSVWVQLKTDDPQKEVNEILERINGRSSEFTYSVGEDFTYKTKNPAFEVKTEYLIDRLILFAAKHYTLRTTEGEIVIKGRKRSDTSEYSMNMFMESSEMLLDRRKDDMVEYLRDNVQYIISGVGDPYILGVPKRWGKRLKDYKDVPIQVRAALFSNEHLGTDFQYGDKVRYLHVKSLGDYPNEVEHDGKVHDVTAIALQENTKLPDEIKIDWERVVEGDVKGKMEPMMDMIGVSWKAMIHRLIAKKNYRTLDNFVR
jgi:DNA polymerase I